MDTKARPSRKKRRSWAFPLGLLVIVLVVAGVESRRTGQETCSEYIAQEIEYETGIETVKRFWGYIQRGGSPTPFDRNLSTRMGGHATELIAGGQFGRMVTLKGNEISSAPLGEIAGKLEISDRRP